MLRIWGRVNSINVKKVLWCCEEARIPYQRVDAGMKFGVVDTPEYAAKNPNRLVPTIEDDGFVLWESQAIVRYLARRYALGTLCPMDEHGAADADRWMDWQATTLWPNLRHVFWGLVRKPEAERDMQHIGRCAADLGKSYTILDAHLAGRDHVCGHAFTMGDIPLGTTLYYYFSLPIERPALPRLEAYYEGLKARPAYRNIVMIPLT